MLSFFFNSYVNPSFLLPFLAPDLPSSVYQASLYPDSCVTQHQNKINLSSQCSLNTSHLYGL